MDNTGGFSFVLIVILIVLGFTISIQTHNNTYDQASLLFIQNNKTSKKEIEKTLAKPDTIEYKNETEYWYYKGGNTITTIIFKNDTVVYFQKLKK